MVTTISEQFYLDHLQSDYPLKSIGDLLSVEVGNGHLLDYKGYVEVDILLPPIGSSVPVEQYILALVVPDTPYNHGVPICIGTNVISRYREYCIEHHGVRFLQSVTIPRSWNLAFQSFSNQTSVENDTVIVSSTNDTIIEPNEQVVIHGLCRVPCIHNSSMLIESNSENDIPGGVILMPQLVHVKGSTQTSRVGVRLYNISSKKVTIPRNMVIAQLSSVQQVHPVVDHSGELLFESKHAEDTDCTVQLNDSCLDESQVNDVHQFLNKWRKVFSFESDTLGHTDNIKHRITLDNDTPFKERTRRIPPGMYDEIRQHLKEMLESGIIRESCSPWSSNVVCVRKKNGRLRLCIDFRKLNARTVHDSYALPRIEDTLDSL